LQFIYFLGRFHVVILHLPIGIILGLVIVEWLERRPQFSHLRKVAPFLWGALGVSALITVALGYMHYAEGGFTSSSANYHRISGTLVGVIALIGWLLSSRFETLYRKSQIALLSLLIVLVIIAGHTGGNLTHGSTYLVEYAPQPFRSLAGLSPHRPPITDVAMADPFLDVVQPILVNHCSTCHGENTQRKNLSLITYRDVMRGGSSGPVIIASDILHSDLFHRITLPRTAKGFMPTDGKAPLTDAEVKLIGWWIQSGAKTNTQIGKMDVPSDLKPLMLAELGLGGTPPVATASAEPGEETEGTEHRADQALVDNLNRAGFAVRQVSLSDPLLIVNLPIIGANVTDDNLKALAPARDQIIELDLRRSSVQDAQLNVVGQLTNLSRLHLESDQISDAGIRSIANLKNLKTLNLYGDQKVTDRSIPVFAKLAGLQEVYLWNTGVTARGAAELRKERPDLKVNIGEADSPNVTPAVQKNPTVAKGGTN
jgi:hypothetical protein